MGMRAMFGAAIGVLALGTMTACGGGGSGGGGGGVPAAPTPVTVVAPATPGELDVTWGAVPGATSYLVSVSPFPSIATNADALPGDITVRFASLTSISLDGLWNGGPYYVVVRATNDAGPGPYSAERSAYPTPLRPIMVAVAGSPNAVRVAWPPVLGATSYDLFLAADPTVTSTNWASLPAGVHVTTASTLANVVGLRNGTTYWAVVRATNPSGASGDSAPRSGVPTARGTFEASGGVDVGDNPQGSVTALLDGDAFLDLSVVDGDANEVKVFLGLGDGTFAFNASYATGDGPASVIAVDLDADGDLELVTANDDGSVSVFDGNGAGGFTDVGGWWVGGTLHGLCAGQFNPASDGALDLVVTDTTNARVVVIFGVGDETFWGDASFSTGSQPQMCRVADVNGDGYADVLTVNNPAGTVTALLADGWGDFPARYDSYAGLTSEAMDVADFDGDGVLDLVVTSALANSVTFLRGAGDGTFTPSYPLVAGSLVSAVVAGDFDGDGVTDLIVANEGDGSVVMLRGDGLGNFLPFSTVVAGVGADHMTVGDFNGDGILDVLVTTPGTGDVTILLGSA